MGKIGRKSRSSTYGYAVSYKICLWFYPEKSSLGGQKRPLLAFLH